MTNARTEQKPACKDLYVLTGFLGSGKTTLLNDLLKEVKNKKIGVIQNEFGKISIDGEILRSQDGITMQEISAGSIFCTCLKLKFVEALAQMAQEDLDLVVVESSGLADPSNIGEILAAVTELTGPGAYCLRGVICLVDALHFNQQLPSEETVLRQLVHCHLAVINKSDLVEDKEIQAIQQSIRSVNPKCLIEVTSFGKIKPETWETDYMAYQWKEDEASLNMVDNKPKTLSLTADVPLPKEGLEAFLRAVAPDAYRIKGFAQLTDGWVQVDMVEERLDFKPCSPKKETQLVFLSKVSIQIVRTVHDEWEKNLALPVHLHN